jgi:hypothetical protein
MAQASRSPVPDGAWHGLRYKVATDNSASFVPHEASRNIIVALIRLRQSHNKNGLETHPLNH